MTLLIANPCQHSQELSTDFLLLDIPDLDRSSVTQHLRDDRLSIIENLFDPGNFTTLCITRNPELTKSLVIETISIN